MKNSHGMGFVYQPTYTVRLADGSKVTKTTATWSIQYFVHGVRMRESSGSTDPKQAAKLLKLRTSQALLGQAVLPAMTRTRFTDLEQMLRDDYRMKDRRSLSRVEGALKHLNATFGMYLARNISADRVASYIVDRQNEGAATATINRELSALKHAFVLAEQAKKVSDRPKITLLAEDNARQGFVNAGEFDRLHAELPADLKDPVRFLFLSGWRVGEMRSLEWRDIDLDAMVITLRAANSKTKKSRQLALREELAAIIQRAMATRTLSCTFVFQRNGKKVGLFRKSWATACKKAGLGAVLVHDLRRSAIRNLIRAGVSDTVAMSMSGHKTRSVFDRYNITSVADQAHAVEQVADYLSAQPKTSANVVPLRTAQEQPKIEAAAGVSGNRIR